MVITKQDSRPIRQVKKQLRNVTSCPKCGCINFILDDATYYVEARCLLCGLSLATANKDTLESAEVMKDD